MGFFKIIQEPGPRGSVIIKPEYKLIDPDTDLMTRGGKFYAVWNGLKWSKDEFDVIRLIDSEIERYLDNVQNKDPETKYVPYYLNNFRYRNNASWSDFSAFVKNRPSSFELLDQKLTFASDKINRNDKTSKRLPYDIVEGPTEKYDELMDVLFSNEERTKLEWAIGSILTGDSKTNHKFVVLYAEPGTGKSTFLNIVEKMFEGYVASFDAKALGKGDSFATSSFKTGPLVAIQHDGDLSRVLDNTKLNSIISHEPIHVNDKYERQYAIRLNAFIFMGTNKPVQITDSKSGLIRRLIDVYPRGEKIDEVRFRNLVESVYLEIPHIAYHCKQVYMDLGRHYYDSYKPIGMMAETDTLYNFVDENFYDFANNDFVTLKRAYVMYKAYVEESGLNFLLPKYKFKVELKSYFYNFYPRTKDIEGHDIYNVYTSFRKDKFESTVWRRERVGITLKMPFKNQPSIFDMKYKDSPAQEARPNGLPKRKWKNNSEILKDIDTTELHFVKVPPHHIVIDFDKKDSNGKKSLEINIEAASKWPPTYAEISKSGGGVHLHYLYAGDTSELRRVYEEGIEVKVFTGDASLRRKLTQCTSTPINYIQDTYLPRGKKKMIDKKSVKSEKALRRLIEKNLRKEIHPATKPSIDFIVKLLDDAYDEGFEYDVRDMKQSVIHFAMGSTNQKEYCIDAVTNKMKFTSDQKGLEGLQNASYTKTDDSSLVFFDVEVFPNLFIVVYKVRGIENKPVRMINPPSELVGKLFDYKLVGFNNKAYDNHILYGRYLGYTNEELFNLSKNLISKKRGNGIPGFGPAYNLSYADIYDFSTKRQSLKKFEIELGLHHKELDFPWDIAVPEDRWEEVAIYCENDVIATEAVFDNRQQDYFARKILAELSGLTVNHSTRKHTARIIFGDDKTPQKHFIYTDLGEVEFPGYTFDITRSPKSLYKGINPSEGGYVYAVPGVYENVEVYDIASMHPASIINLNMFGKYTQRYEELRDGRIAIKHGRFDEASKMLNGVFAPYLKDKKQAKNLAYSIKIPLNTVYGLTKARFPNEFLDPRNKDNIVAKRGALFMIDLQEEVTKRGYKVVHIKTDSIKVVNPDKEIRKFIFEFGQKYGYTFEHEHTYSKFCLVNDAVYIAKIGWSDDEREIGTWSATGAQFAHPYVFKTLFSGEEITLSDLQETKQVQKGRMYLDFNEGLEEDHNYVHVGRVGAFVPVKEGKGGGLLYSKHVDTGKYNHVGGTKGYRWKELTVVEKLDDPSLQIDMEYYRELSSKAIHTINKFGSFDQLIDK